MAEKTRRPRTQCKRCKQVLSYSTYLHHRSMLYCPGYEGPSRQKTCNFWEEIDHEDFSSADSPNTSLESSSQSSQEMIDTDESTLNCKLDDMNRENDQTVENDDDDCSDTSSSGSEYNSESDGPEVWSSDEAHGNVEETRIESQSNIEACRISRKAEQFVWIICFFISLLQLGYQLSERGAQMLLKFMKMLFKTLALVTDNVLITLVSSILPLSLYSARRKIYLDTKMKDYIVCTKCHALYDQHELIKANLLGQDLPKCTIIDFPNHRQVFRRTKCGGNLLKSTRVGKKEQLIPCKQYVYNGVTSTLQMFLNRPNFLHMCQHWRNRTVSEGMLLHDVYDGKLWKKWSSFLKEEANLLLMMNVDWFRPFKHIQYSAGVIYLVIQNLPRSIRFKTENVYLFHAFLGI